MKALSSVARMDARSGVRLVHVAVEWTDVVMVAVMVP